jgi:hypothetical protein
MMTAFDIDLAPVVAVIVVGLISVLSVRLVAAHARHRVQERTRAILKTSRTSTRSGETQFERARPGQVE